MSARALQRVTALLRSGRTPLVYRCSSIRLVGDTPSPTPKPKGALEQSGSATPETPAMPDLGPPAVEFDNSQYQAKDMYDYTPMSFYDMELDMSVSRCPQPSSKKAS